MKFAKKKPRGLFEELLIDLLCVALTTLLIVGATGAFWGFMWDWLK